VAAPVGAATAPGSRPAITPIQRFLDVAVRRTVPNRTLLVRGGEPPEMLFYVISGAVEVVVEDDQGKQMVLVYLGEGEFFGTMVSLGVDSGRSTLIRSRGRSDIATMYYARFKQLAAENPALALNLAMQLSQRLEQATRKLRDLAFVDVTGRIEWALRELAEADNAMTHPEGMQIRVSRQDLARLVGCSREMAGRALKSLEDEGVLRATGKTVVMIGIRPGQMDPSAMATRRLRNTAA
jgi:CRP/FNR family cyclic AMP-dependent transcriptional regulator